jgi:hypothetical protein
MSFAVIVEYWYEITDRNTPIVAIERRIARLLFVSVGFIKS